MSEMTLPALSVVTPVYNMETYIGETLRSVLGAMRSGDRYVVVDDGSRDGTGDVLSSFGSAIVSLWQPNQGEAAAVNAGVAATETDIVGIVNADDPILPGLLDAVRCAFRDDAALAAVYPDWVKIDAAGRRIGDVKTLDFDYEVMLAEHMCIPGPGAFFRKSVLNGEPVRDPLARGISDFDFWLRFARHGALVRRLPVPLATWRLHGAGTTVTSAGARLATTRIEVIERLLAKPDLSPEIRRLGPRALSAAYYNAALVGLRGSAVPALRYALKSYALAARWPKTVLPHQQRSLPHLMYAATQPLSGLVHRLADPLLPRRFRREAVLGYTFGLHVETDH